MDSYEEQNNELTKIGDLTSYSRSVNTIVKVVSKTEPREVTSRVDDSQHRVCEALVGDETGSVYLTLWDEAIDEIDENQILKLSNAYVNLFRGSMRLNIGRYGRYEIEEEAPFEEVNLDNNLSSKMFEQPRYGYGRGRQRRPSRSRRRY